MTEFISDYFGDISDVIEQLDSSNLPPVDSLVFLKVVQKS